ncbi:hypothetical protein AGLY_009379, partial [Aphis glycines]
SIKLINRVYYIIVFLFNLYSVFDNSVKKLVFNTIKFYCTYGHFELNFEYFCQFDEQLFFSSKYANEEGFGSKMTNCICEFYYFIWMSLTIRWYSINWDRWWDFVIIYYNSFISTLTRLRCLLLAILDPNSKSINNYKKIEKQYLTFFTIFRIYVFAKTKCTFSASALINYVFRHSFNRKKTDRNLLKNSVTNKQLKINGDGTVWPCDKKL